jgi:hypothetical protein
MGGVAIRVEVDLEGSCVQIADSRSRGGEDIFSQWSDLMLT